MTNNHVQNNYIRSSLALRIDGNSQRSISMPCLWRFLSEFQRLKFIGLLLDTRRIHGKYA